MFLSLPASLSISAALLIPLYTVVVRSTVTLPAVLWQRRRTRYFQEKVLPEIKKEQTVLAYQVRDESRRKGLSYEQYQVEFKKRAKAAAKAITAKHGANPYVTILVPPALHIPVLILSTLVLRDACQRSLDSLQFPHESALAHLHEFAVEPLLWCQSIVLTDPTMGLPLAVGIAALLNVEVTARNRKMMATAVEVEEEAVGASEKSRGTAVPGNTLSAAARQRMSAQVNRMRSGASGVVGGGVMGGKGKRSYAVTAVPREKGKGTKADDVVVEEGEDGREPRTQRIISNALRLFSVAFIPFAALAPAALCTYWLSSNVFSLVQNSIFAIFDRRREAARLKAIK